MFKALLCEVRYVYKYNICNKTYTKFPRVLSETIKSRVVELIPRTLTFVNKQMKTSLSRYVIHVQRQKVIKDYESLGHETNMLFQNITGEISNKKFF